MCGRQRINDLIIRTQVLFYRVRWMNRLTRQPFMVDGDGFDRPRIPL